MKTARPPVLLVLAVLALHLLLGREVQRIQEGWVRDDAPPSPARMQVEFVREMAMQAPAVHATPPPRRAPAAQAMPGAAPAASQPASHPASHPASAPERLPIPEPVAEVAPVPAEAVPPVAVAASAVSSDEPGPEWPLSTRLSYVLSGNYRGPVTGQAQVEWLRKGRDYQVHLDVDVGLVARRMSSQGRLTSDGIAPQRYDEETKLLLVDARRSSVLFQGAEVQLANGRREPVQRGSQDSASQFVQLTWLFLTGREPLQAGHVVRFPLVLPRRQYAWQYEVVGEEMLDTPMGPVASWHLRPGRSASGGDLTAEVWLAPALQYLPVRLVIRQDADNYIDLMLKRAPLQAAPESIDPSRRPAP
ncbi:DUF3108 domain-containing protein [Roseateles sp.]|uniref:DUF3108 domain-containing protein n=1 Tax=Roseateles sp. TaxID=1971397 RepID=UPI0039E9E1A7